MKLSTILGFLSVLLGVMTLGPLAHTGFTVNDDQNTTIMSSMNWSGLLLTNDRESALRAERKDKIMVTAWHAAIAHGRFHYLASYPLAFVPYVVDSNLYYQLTRLAPIALNVLLFYFVVRNLLGSKSLAFLAVIGFWAFLQNSWWGNLVTSYPFVFHFGISCLFGALLLFHRHLKTPRPAWAVLSGILYFLALLTHEAHVLLGILFLLAWYALHPERQWRARLSMSSLRLLLPVAIPLGLFLAAYFIFRLWHPSFYPGNKIGIESAVAVLRTVWRYSVSALPGYYFFNDPFLPGAVFGVEPGAASLHSLLSHMKTEWLLKALIVGFATTVALRWDDVRPKLRVLVWTALLFPLPNVLLALTPHHNTTMAAAGIQSHTTTYFSFFPALVFMAAAAKIVDGTLDRRGRWRWMWAVFVAVAAASFTLLTEFHNYYITHDQTVSQDKWRVVNRFLQSAEFAAIPHRCVIYAPTLFQARGSAGHLPGYWSAYFRNKSGRRIFVTGKPEDLASDESHLPLYFLKYEHDPLSRNAFLIFAKIPPSQPVLAAGVVAREATLYSFGENKRFTILGAKGAAPLLLDGAPVAASQGRCFSLPIDHSRAQTDFPSVHLGCEDGIEWQNLTLSYFPTVNRVFVP